MQVLSPAEFAHHVANATSSVAVYTDGACKGNPGPGGWGVYAQAGSLRLELCGGELLTTNNRMELQAAIQALRAISAWPTAPGSVMLFLDSEYVRQGVLSWVASWKLKGWRTSAGKPVKNEDLWRELDGLKQHCVHKLQWHWVKGHAGHPGNERADALANRGVPGY